MALTLANRTTTVEGQKRKVTVDVTFDSSYPTGGEAFTAASLGLTRIEFVPPAVNSAGTRLAVWDGDVADPKLQLFTAVGTEATDGSNQSTITVPLYVIGY